MTRLALFCLLTTSVFAAPLWTRGVHDALVDCMSGVRQLRAPSVHPGPEGTLWVETDLGLQRIDRMGRPVGERVTGFHIDRRPAGVIPVCTLPGGRTLLLGIGEDPLHPGIHKLISLALDGSWGVSAYRVPPFGLRSGRQTVLSPNGRVYAFARSNERVECLELDGTAAELTKLSSVSYEYKYESHKPLPPGQRGIPVQLDWASHWYRRALAYAPQGHIVAAVQRTPPDTLVSVYTISPDSFRLLDSVRLHVRSDAAWLIAVPDYREPRLVRCEGGYRLFLPLQVRPHLPGEGFTPTDTTAVYRLTDELQVIADSVPAFRAPAYELAPDDAETVVRTRLDRTGTPGGETIVRADFYAFTDEGMVYHTTRP